MSDTHTQNIKELVTDFLGSAPSLEEIANYRLPSGLQERAVALLDKNRSNGLSADERGEMEEFRQIDHLLTLVKAKARLRLQSKTK
jgi:hypothetical protein